MYAVAGGCSEIAVKSQQNKDGAAGQEEVRMNATCLKRCSQWSKQNKKPDIEGSQSTEILGYWIINEQNSTQVKVQGGDHSTNVKYSVKYFRASCIFSAVFSKTVTVRKWAQLTTELLPTSWVQILISDIFCDLWNTTTVLEDLLVATNIWFIYNAEISNNASQNSHICLKYCTKNYWHPSLKMNSLILCNKWYLSINLQGHCPCPLIVPS